MLSAAVMTQGVLLYAYAQMGGGGGGAGNHGKVSMVSDSTVFGIPLGAAGTIAFGILCVLTNLFLEGYTNAAQDRIFSLARKAAKPLDAQLMMFGMNLWSVIFLLISLSSEFFMAGTASTVSYFVSFATRHPELLIHIATFSTFGAIAQLFIFACLEGYGGFTTTSITVTRKIVSVLFSVIVY